MQIPDQPALTSLLAELERHPVNANVFFTAFETGWLTQAQLQAFLRQYHYFCKHFVKLLEGLLYNTPLDQVEMRIGLVKTLYSELGNGRPDRAHITLLNRFAGAVGLTETDLARTVPIPAVEQYMQVLRRLFVESDYLTALGAETAIEVTAVSEFRYLYPGLQKYSCFREDDLEFFKLHLHEEECHALWLLNAVNRTATGEADIAVVEAAAQQTADAWHRFWLGLYREVFGKPADATA